MGARRGGRLKWGAVLAALALSAAACGSTARQSAQRSAAGRPGAGDSSLNGSSGTSGGASGGLGGSASGSATGASAGGASRGRTGASGAGGPAGSGTGALTGGGATGGFGPGVSATAINIGIVYATNSQAANAAIGASGISQGDEKLNSEVLIDDINAHGGIAGRKVVGVYHALDATSTSTTDNQYQAACDDLTQDHKVFAVMAGNNEVLLRCLQNRGVVALTSNLTMADTAVFKRYPYYVELQSLNLDRIAAAEVPALNAQGWFSGWNAATGQPAPTKAKIGVVTYDLPAFAHATDQVLVPALAKLGYAPAPGDIVRAPYQTRASDVSGSAAAVSGAVLKFRGDGVSHVIILEASGVLSLLFGNNADSQRYYPRYGANSQTGQQALVDSGAYPKSQLTGTLGIGWEPSIDITPSENPPGSGPYSNDAQRRCIALYKSRGVTFSDTNAAAIGYLNCNDFWFFRDVMNRTKSLTRDGYIAVVNSVGSFKSLTVIGTKLDAAHHDAIAAVRYWAYKPECGCMRYTSGDIPA